MQNKMNDFKQRFEDLLDDIVNDLSKKEADHIFCYFKERLDEIECLSGKKMRMTNNKVNLCDSCKYTYPDCSANKDDILFGDGVGDDNICCCNRYRVKMPDNTVSKGVYEQVAWERDVAIGQLKELGYGFGEKIRYDDDTVSRKEVLRMIDCINDHNAITPYKSVEAITEHLMRIAKGLLTVTPKAPQSEGDKV